MSMIDNVHGMLQQHDKLLVSHSIILHTSLMQAQF